MSVKGEWHMDFPIVPFQYISSYTFAVSLQSFTLKAEDCLCLVLNRHGGRWRRVVSGGEDCIATLNTMTPHHRFLCVPCATWSVNTPMEDIKAHNTVGTGWERWGIPTLM